ncbi:macrophage mannose receptor 1-like [Alosa alosa]|uniref:macrophage mannose receptor 1-like n=1 Tax=Alosa alosa TaxID=278164 RepID=UPI0020150E72|nr:macrophage mannose receptor 1-like [Alosa alosa]
MTEMEKVNHTIHEVSAENGNRAAWIGLFKQNDPWKWSDGSSSSFRNWKTGEPNNGDKKEFCTKILNSSGAWNDAGCDHRSHFICYEGLGSLSSSVPRQFHVVKEQKNWTEAQQYCREEFTDLATIDNMTEMEKLKSLIHKAGGNSTHVLVTERKNWADAQRYCRENHTDLACVRNQTENDKIEDVRGSRGAWIGLFRDAWEWSDGSSSSFRHWNTGEPNDVDGKEFCAEIQNASGARWNDRGCYHRSHFICSEDKLVLVRDNKTWLEALQYCREHHVDLVSVTSERVQRWVRERAKGASTAHVWLGLRHACGLGWFWVCGETVCYNHWAPGQEQVESCKHRVGAVESGGGQWVSNLTETDKLNFICICTVEGLNALP